MTAIPDEDLRWLAGEESEINQGFPRGEVFGGALLSGGSDSLLFTVDWTSDHVSLSVE